MVGFSHMRVPALALAALAGLSLFAQTPRLRVGITSDTHLGLADGPDQLKSVFGTFKRRGTDVVVISGDLVEDGKVAEYAYFLRIWTETFGAKPGRDGAPGLFLVWGNHDYRAASKFRNRTFTAAEADAFMLAHKDEVWRLFFDEPFPGEVYARTYGGVTFVGAHWQHEAETVPWLKAHANEVGTSNLFVYVQHPYLSGTVYLGARNGSPETLTKELSAWPNCFSISGHCHSSLADDTALWQGAFTAMSAGTVKGVSLRHGTGVPSYANGRFSQKNAKPPYPHMKPCAGGRSGQGAVLSLYADRVVVERIDFARDKKVGDDWELPLPLETHPESPFVLATRAKGPEFPVGAKVTAKVVDGCNAMMEPERQLSVQVVQAVPVSKYGRTVWNRFEVLDAATGEVLRTADALQPGQALPLDEGLRMPADCAFALSDLPQGRSVRVRVTPMNAAGVPGRPLAGDVLSL